MAKVKAPLLSLDARGQIGKTLVFMGWKGLKDVREYVVPANPQTAAQQTQRGYLTGAVTIFHASEFSAKDMAAWVLAASTMPTPRTGFNQCVKRIIDVAVGGDAWAKVRQVTVDGVTSDAFDIHAVALEAVVSIKAFYGTSPTFMPNSVAGEWNAGNSVWDFALTGLNSSTKYYFTIIAEWTGNYGRTGIYTQETSG